jgi:hypothetical protein
MSTNKVSSGRAIFIVAVVLQVIVFEQRLDNCAPGKHYDKFTLNINIIEVKTWMLVPLHVGKCDWS